MKPRAPSAGSFGLRAAARFAIVAVAGALVPFGVSAQGPAAATAIARIEDSGGEITALRAEARANEHGEGIPRNPGRAAELYCLAARRGDAESQYGLGWMYANGRGLPRDDALAAYFFDMAARQGHAHAARMQRYVGEPTRVTPECMREIVKEDFDHAGNDVVAADDPQQQRIAEIVRRLAPDFGVSPRLALSVIRAESNFKSAAVSDKNAQGLMQLIPETSARFNVRKPFDPEQNIRGGLAYLRWLLAYFKGDVALVAAAYNAGEGAVNRHLGVPPYAETRGYVKRIIEWFKKNEHPFDPAVTEPSPELARIRARQSM